MATRITPEELERARFEHVSTTLWSTNPMAGETTWRAAGSDLEMRWPWAQAQARFVCVAAPSRITLTQPLVGDDGVELSASTAMRVLMTAVHGIKGWQQTALQAAQNLGVTAYEAECLRWAHAGKSAAETSLILRRTPASVEKSLLSAYRKLGVLGKTTAVLRAEQMGMIQP